MSWRIPKSFAPAATLTANYTLTGLNLPTGQNILVRARGFYRSGYQNGSESIQETVKNVFFATTSAANVSVSGRVLTADGRGLRNAIVSIIDSHSVMRIVTTGAFGDYGFEDVETGETYVIGVASKRYRFASRVLQVTDTLTSVDFVGDE